jgi:hypothetical protein
MSHARTTETITLGGGCFWCTEAVYDRVEGVLDVESGYANGHVDHPTYEQVCTGTTGHAEVVKVEFDPSRISLREILEIFFVIHDPTTPDLFPCAGAGDRHPRRGRARGGAAVRPPGGHRDRAAALVLAGRGLPPELLREAPAARLLRVRGRAQGREVPPDLREQGAARLRPRGRHRWPPVPVVVQGRRS